MAPTDGRPLVSVLTPTWRRPELLQGAIENVRAQTYRPLEHVIISDGPDTATALVAVTALDCAATADVLVRYVPLGRNWSSYLDDSFCAAPMTAAMLVASGDYQCWLADDERLDPDHVASLVGLLEREQADFAYSKVGMWRAGAPADRWTIGCHPPRLGEITHALYRTEVLKHGLYVFGDDRASDWATISRWQSRGARAAFLDRVTMTHRVDR